MQLTPAEDEYVKQELKNWQTSDVKEVEAKNDTAKKSENIVEKPQKEVEKKPKEEAKTIETEIPKKEESVPAAAVPSLTLEQLRAGCAEMSRLGKGAELRRLIREVYKIPKLDDLDPKNYESFANDLRELGVRI